MDNETKKQTFAKAILDLSDSVYYSCTQYENEFYFYPKNLDSTVKINVTNSKSIDLSFIFDNKKNDKQPVVSNLNLGDVENCPEFMTSLYAKHEDMLNSGMEVYNKFKETVELLLSGQLNWDTNLIKANDTIKINFKNKDASIIVNFRDVYNSERPIIFKPIAPVVLDCFVEESNGERGLFKKVMPAYKVNEYDLIRENIMVNTSDKDIYLFLDSLIKKEDSQRRDKVLAKILLELELPEQQINKKINKI